MKPSKLVEVLSKCVEARKPVLIKGAPGVGKSDIVALVAKQLDADLVINHPVVDDPTDYKGLAGIVNGKAEFLPFGNLRKLITAKKPTICFLDDLGQAPACVQAAAMQLLLARQINGHKVSEQVTFVAATNRREDRAGVTGILEPVKSRFATILELTVDVDDWVQWAFQNNMPEKLIAFIHFRPDLLTHWKPTPDISNGPCPRTFANAGGLIQIGVEDIESLTGAVGEGCAIEMHGFFKYWEQLPSIESIINNPNDAKVPTELAALYAVTTALASKADKKNSDAIFTYGARLPKDFYVLLGRDSIRKDPSVKNTKGFTKWMLDNKDVFF